MIWKAVGAALGILAWLAGPKRLPNQGSPVKYHESAAAAAQRQAALEPATSWRWPERKIPEWVDPPLLPDGTYEECSQCEDGFETRADNQLYLCSKCNGMILIPHGDHNDESPDY